MSHDLTHREFGVIGLDIGLRSTGLAVFTPSLHGRGSQGFLTEARWKS